ncbi:MAG: cobalamin-independent methionine synthase II family protein [Nitriliruptorales bacterium]
MIEARSDVVGSLLRPKALLEARERYVAGELDTPAFKAVEDAAVDQALAIQEEAGLDVVTDGEMRRLSFQSQMTEAVDGFGDWGLDAFLWGRWESDELGEWPVKRPDLRVVERLHRRRFLSAEEFTYVRGRTDRTVKVTLPSPSLFSSFYDPADHPDEYPTLDSYLSDVAEILSEEVDELVRLGATYIQLDAPHYTMFVDPDYRDFYESRGIDADRWIDAGIELDNAVIGDRPDVTFAFHLCRGNQASRWLVAGGYEIIAEQIFTGVRADRFMLEYDDERSGGFDPLKTVPEDTHVVLGLVSTKHGRLEDRSELVRRIEDASGYVDRERLAVSTQCGFGTSVLGNSLTQDEQRAKLELVAEVAKAAWS